MFSGEIGFTVSSSVSMRRSWYPFCGRVPATITRAELGTQTAPGSNDPSTFRSRASPLPVGTTASLGPLCARTNLPSGESASPWPSAMRTGAGAAAVRR